MLLYMSIELLCDKNFRSLLLVDLHNLLLSLFSLKNNPSGNSCFVSHFVHILFQTFHNHWWLGHEPHRPAVGVVSFPESALGQKG